VYCLLFANKFLAIARIIKKYFSQRCRFCKTDLHQEDKFLAHKKRALDVDGECSNQWVSSHESYLRPVAKLSHKKDSTDKQHLKNNRIIAKHIIHVKRS
jgi:hypothetical protein